jgi:uncharacterized BrkB/YihY/UPF0761 family membrane protein
MGIIKKYLVSLLFLAFTLLIFIFQISFPDVVPDLIKEQIEKAPPEFVGLKSSYEAVLIFYTWSGVISLFVSITSAIVIYFRNNRR